jgi:hypothetical protein
MRIETHPKESTMRTSDRRHRALVALLGATLALMTIIGPVGAAGSAKPVSMTITAYFDRDPFSGPFTATGAQICPSGTAEDIPDSFVGGAWSSGQVIQIQLTKLLTCDDGSGTILLASPFHVALASGETSTWHIAGGTGAYANLHGSGTGVTENRLDPHHGGRHERRPPALAEPREPSITRRHQTI